MPKLFGGLAGLIALAAGIFGNIDAITCLQRAAVSFVIGACVGAFWQSVTSVPTPMMQQPAKRPESTEKEVGKAA